MFWKLCKRTDVSGQLSFDLDFKAMASISKPRIEASDNSKKKKQAARDWIKSLSDRRHQWAACCTWLRKTYGVHSTQRAEATNSAVKRFCSKRSKIVDLVLDLERMSESQQMKAEAAAMKDLFIANSNQTGNILPVAQALSDKLEDCPAAVVHVQANQLCLYTTVEGAEPPDLSGVDGWDGFPEGESVHCVEINAPQKGSSDKDARREADSGIREQGSFTTSNNNESTPRPRHWTSVSQCTCLFHHCHGLPCRHRFYVMMLEKFVGAVSYDRFWEKRSKAARQARSVATTTALASAARFSSTQIEVGGTPSERRPRLKAALGKMEDVAVESAAATKEAIATAEAFVKKHERRTAAPKDDREATAADEESSHSDDVPLANLVRRKAPASKALARNPPLLKQNDPRKQPADDSNPGSKIAKRRKRKAATEARKTFKKARSNPHLKRK